MEDENIDVMGNHSFTPTWENMDRSPTIVNASVQVFSKYKIKLKYRGYFRLAKNSSKKRYCFGSQKCIYIDACIFGFDGLIEEVVTHYPLDRELVFSLYYIDKYASEQSYIKVDSHDTFQLMLSVHEVAKELTVYVTTDNNRLCNKALYIICRVRDGEHDEERGEEHGEEQSKYALSDDSYHRYYGTDSEVDSTDIEVEQEDSQPKTYKKESRAITINSTFENVKEFRIALAHYAITKGFSYYIEKSEPKRVTARCFDLKCKWRIHASLMQDGITFEVKKLVDIHSCTRSNKGAAKVETQGWVASVIIDKLKSDGDVSPTKLQKWIMKNYDVDVPYMKVHRGKEQAQASMYGKWDDSFLKINDYKEELLKRNPGSVVEVDYETKGNKKLFLRFFVSLIACSKGFLDGCRPYISLDACHLKGRFNGVLFGATGVDDNNSIFLVAYGVLESENKNSWIWFLELLKKAIGTPNGLVISFDMQKV
ncbi:uncharacterized protein LOC143586914 [Bidens hawaiensis]|uniref:uncharacterized protein LOC143586914 n=1 Tax=Bidens hawaiensis TaxID=980011 RepID=UPI004049C40D